MAFIKRSRNRSSFDYKFSVYSKDDLDLIILRDTVMKYNEQFRRGAKKRGKAFGSLKRVSLKARGPRKIWSLQDHPDDLSGTSYTSYLPHKYAEYFDVYVNDDTTNTFVLNRELETGLTPAMQRKKDKLIYEARLIEWEGKQRLQNAA